METVILPHMPQYPLQVCLFSDVQNAPFLRQQLLDGNSAFEYAFLDATMLLSKNQVLAACFRAINDKLNNRLKSRNVHSEIVFALSPNSNIAESFRRFGISNETKNILAIKVGGNKLDVESHLNENVEGNPQPFTDEVLSSMNDLGRIQKIYRLGALKKNDTGNQLDHATEKVVMGSMVLKGS